MRTRGSTGKTSTGTVTGSAPAWGSTPERSMLARKLSFGELRRRPRRRPGTRCGRRRPAPRGARPRRCPEHLDGDRCAPRARGPRERQADVEDDGQAEGCQLRRPVAEDETPEGGHGRGPAGDGASTLSSRLGPGPAEASLSGASATIAARLAAAALPGSSAGAEEPVEPLPELVLVEVARRRSPPPPGSRRRAPR